MGVSSIVLHASGKKHIKAMSSSSSSLTLEFFSEPPQKVVGPEEKKVHQRAPGSKKLDQYVQLHQIISAEILWTLKVVMSKMSLRSCEQLKLFFLLCSMIAT